MASVTVRVAPSLLLVALGVACGSNAEHPPASASGAGAGGSGAGPSSSSTTSTGTTTSGASASSASTASSGPGGAGPCEGGADADMDADGFSPNSGDCDDCNADVNPGAVDYVETDDNDVPLPVQLDNDCDGTVTMPGDAPPCDDSGLAVDDPDPLHAAAAMELCQQSDGITWGVLAASWVQIDGTPMPDHLGHGILSAFGPNVQPRSGVRMLALSSGTARQPSDAGFQPVDGYDKGYECASPPGYPLYSCDFVENGEVRDSATLRVEIKVPTNAYGFLFDAKFYTAEYPTRICTSSNDIAAVFQTPPPLGAIHGNILYDNEANSLSANTAAFEVCAPGIYGGKVFHCLGGPAELAGTGYDAGAATTWLRVAAPIETGDTVTLDLAIADAEDGVRDSTLLVDAFRWITQDPEALPGDPVADPR